MGLSINGRISLQDIKNEFGDPDGDGQFKFSEYYRGDSSSQPVKNISRNTNIATAGEIRASQFYGSAKVFLPSETDSGSGWPDNNNSALGGTSTSNGIWLPQEYTYASNSFPQAWASMQFSHEPQNSRVRCYWETGHSGRGTTSSTGYFNYAGLETATWQVKYDVENQTSIGDDDYLSYGPLPTDNGFTPGVYYTLENAYGRLFGWQAQASSGDRTARTFVTALSFTLRATLGSDTFTTYFSLLGASGGNYDNPELPLPLPLPIGKGVSLAADYSNVPMETGK